MTATPPPTTLSTPSPTEQDPEAHDYLPTDSSIPSASALIEMNTFKTAKPIYLIVATATHPHLGIGFKGQLPWPQIKSDMTFFRKATTGQLSQPTAFPAPADAPKINAVLMGRKTYESIPPKFRPLADRVNVVLTRHDVRGFADRVLHELTAGTQGEEPAEYRLVDRATVNGLAGEVVSIVKRDHDQPLVVVTQSLRKAVDVDARDVFCIGGAEVYGLVLADKGLGRTVRVLRTEVRKVDGGEFECDTFWPEDMDGDPGWEKVGREIVEEWSGCGVPQGREEWKRDEKVGVEIRVFGYERTVV